MYKEIIDLILQSMSNNGYELENIETINAVKERLNGKVFNLEDHIEGLVFSLLSNQRQWNQISENHDEIVKIFNDFNPQYLLNADPEILIKKIRDIKCGNRSIKKQMLGLKDNINVFLSIIEEYGSLDNYVTSTDPNTLAYDLSKGKYKLKGIGIALAMEYLKNVGIDTFKPDVHVRRLFGSNRLNLTNNSIASENEVIDIAHKMSEETDLSLTELDSIIWQFCASKYAEICSEKPNCEKCLLKSRCNYNK